MKIILIMFYLIFHCHWIWIAHNLKHNFYRNHFILQYSIPFNVNHFEPTYWHWLTFTYYSSWAMLILIWLIAIQFLMTQTSAFTNKHKCINLLSFSVKLHKDLLHTTTISFLLASLKILHLYLFILNKLRWFISTLIWGINWFFLFSLCFK